ncbi:MAG: hypothetical protein ACYTDE_00755 [Planctomycetota bacterium]
MEDNDGLHDLFRVVEFVVGADETWIHGTTIMTARSPRRLDPRDPAAMIERPGGRDLQPKSR